MNNNDFTFIDLFSGIGGFRLALEKIGGKAIGYSEISKPAIKVYTENFDTSDDLVLGDISKLKEIPYADIYTGGVPCQSWSVAGSKKGFNDPRGQLWFDTIKLTKIGKPKIFIYENVKGLADPRNKENLDLLKTKFSEIGYNVYHKVLNAFNFGQPQNRERVFLIGIRKDISQNTYKFPTQYTYLPRLSDSLSLTIKNKYPVVKISKSEKLSSFKLSSTYNKGNFFTFCDTRNGENTIHSWDLKETTHIEKDICMIILRNRRKSKYGKKDGNPLSLKDIQYHNKLVTKKHLKSLLKIGILKKIGNKYDFLNSKNSSGINNIYRIFLPSSHVFSTLTKTGTKDFIALKSIPSHILNKKNYFINEIFLKKQYRTLTTKETLLIQGFNDTFKFSVNDRMAFQLLGNSVPVKIVEELGKTIIKYLK